MRTALLLCAALALGGCYNPRYPSETPGSERAQRQSPNTVSNVYRAGTGTVEVVNRSPGPSAVAGATSVRNDEVTLRMDDGTRQTILLPAGSADLSSGDRVEVTSDARLVRR